MQSVTMTTNSIILLLVLSISCLCSTRDVYIQPSEGEHCPGTPCYNITTFGKMADSFSKSSGLVVHFLEGTHLLDLQELVVFTNLTNAVFKGNGRMEQGFHETVWQSTVVIKCTEHSSTGIAFVNSSSITFRYITITNCGPDIMLGNITTLIDSLKFASLGYLNVNNIVIDHISVQNGSRCGLLIITDGTDISIASSSFARNGRVNDQHDTRVDAFIDYTDPLNCDPQKYVHNFLISNTNISGTITTSGLVIKIDQASYSVNIVLDSVQVYNIGNFSILIQSINVPNYNLTINNSRISDTGGDALVVETRPYLITQKYCANAYTYSVAILIANSKFIYTNSDFVVNIDFQGINDPVTIIFESTEFSDNIFVLNVLRVVSFAYQDRVNLVLQNVTFNNNSNMIPIYSTLPISTVCVEFVTLVLNNVSITNNNATGLVAHRTVIMINSTSIFHNNTGTDGGGLAMYGESYLVFQEKSCLDFINNKAQRGGAIFVNTLSTKSPCFYQYVQGTLLQSTRVYFIGNNAETAGSVLFGGNQSCLLFNIPRNFTFNPFYVTFDYSAQTGPSVISSEPTDVCFCDDNNTINCSQTQLTMKAYPGEEINISVVTVGQENGVSPGLITIESQDPAPVETHRTIPMNCTTIAFNPIAVKYSITITSDRSGFISRSVMLNIKKTDCPFGFQISNETGACDCIELTQKASSSLNLKCDAATNTISRQGDAWIGNISDCVIVHSPCPFDYCNTAQVSFSLTDPDRQCALNRTGILCGRCQDGLSLALGSNNCIQCPQFSYLALIIPFAAAGLGLVALLLLLNLTVSISTINGLIFYASIVKISESNGIFFPNGPVPVLSQFIAWLNLDFGIETCFYKGMTAYAKVWLQFAFPLYIWFIIATIIVVCHYSIWLSNKIGGNVVQVLATLILLSFTKNFQAIILAMKFTTLSCARGNIGTIIVWSVDGNLLYFSPAHYALMAAVVLFLLLLAVPYIAALLFDAVIEKYLTRMRFFRKQWIKFKPFIDAYHGPYKDNCRFWTGLLLLVRMLFTLVSLYFDKYAALIFITTSTSVLLSLMLFFGGVYQNKYLNILEWSSLINLILLSAIFNPWLDQSPSAQQVVTTISVGVAFVMFISILAYHVFLRVKNIKCLKRFAITKYRRSNNEETERLLEDDEDYVCKRLVQPTSSEVWMKRESLIYS